MVKLEQYILKVVDYLQDKDLIVPIWKEIYYGLKGSHYQTQLKKRVPEGWKYERIRRKIQGALIMEGGFARARNDRRKADRIIQKLVDEDTEAIKDKLRKFGSLNF